VPTLLLYDYCQAARNNEGLEGGEPNDWPNVEQILPGFRVSRCSPGMVRHQQCALEDEISVGATLVVALNLGRHEACPYIFGGMTEEVAFVIVGSA
jgi:hypothetical protein